MIGQNNLFQISTLCLGLAAAMSNVTTEVSEADPAVTVGYGVAQPVLATKDVVILVNIPTSSHGTCRHMSRVSPAGVHVPAVGLLPAPHLPRLVPHPLLGRGRGVQHVEVRVTRDT